MTKNQVHNTEDMYKQFVKKHQGTTVTYLQYRYIISEFNKMLSEEVLKGKEVNLGKFLGKLRICKVKRTFKKKIVDYGATRKLKAQGIDKVVYFTDDYYYRWCWKKYSAKVKNKSAYKFKPTAGANGNRKKLVRLLKTDEFAHLNFK